MKRKRFFSAEYSIISPGTPSFTASPERKEKEMIQGTCGSGFPDSRKPSHKGTAVDPQATQANAPASEKQKAFANQETPPTPNASPLYNFEKIETQLTLGTAIFKPP